MPVKYFVRIRSYKNPQYANVWLIKKEGPAESGLVHGLGLRDEMKKLVAFLIDHGIEVQRERHPSITDERIVKNLGYEYLIRDARRGKEKTKKGKGSR